MKAYTTIRQFQDRLSHIREDYHERFRFVDPQPKDILLFMKRVKICERNLRSLYKLIAGRRFEEGSIQQLQNLHGMLVSEIMQMDMASGSWQFRVMLKQLDSVTGMIQAMQKHGMKLTFMMKVKVFLNRLIRGQIFTLFTKY